MPLKIKLSNYKVVLQVCKLEVGKITYIKQGNFLIPFKINMI